MTEILTESFCERCGTRYTFEAVAPRRRRMSGLKVLGKGLKNFVMSDDSSLDEALAAARSDVELEATTHQLDAFHKTFNFCMSCRQYTCASCWDAVEGRCLSCSRGETVAPHAPALEEIGARPGIIGLSESPIAAEPWPLDDLRAAILSASAAPVEAIPEPGPVVAPEAVEEVEEETPAAAASGPSIEPPEAALETGPMPEPVALPDVAFESAHEAAPNEAVPEPVAVEPVAALETPTEPGAPIVAPAEELAVDSPAVEAPVAAPSVEPEAAPQPRRSRSRFKPGQSLDEEIAAYEARVAAEAAASTAPVEPEAEAVAATAATVEAESIETAPEPEAIVPAPEPVAAPEPEPVAAIEAEPAPEPQPVAPTTPAPVATPAPIAPRVPPVGPIVQPPTADAPAPRTAPAWRPISPTWPAPAASASTPATTPEPAPLPDPLAAALARRATEAMWAASARDVVRPSLASASTPVAAVQSCQSCGLSLSATARFCRRCGARQDG